MFGQLAQLCLVLGKYHSCANFVVFWRKIGVYGVLSRILFPMCLRVFCANFLDKNCARSNFYAFCMSESDPLWLKNMIKQSKKFA